MLRRGSLGGLIVLMSCGGAGPDGTARDAAARDGAAQNGAAPDVAARDAAANAATPGATATVKAPAAAPAPKLAFHTVVTSSEWLGLHPLLDGTLMISAGPRLLRIDPSGMLRDSPDLIAGIELPNPKGVEFGVEAQVEVINDRGGWTALQVGGTWPGATFLTLATGHHPPAAVYRWEDERWTAAKPGRAAVHTWPRTIRPWKDRSLLAWREIHVPALDLSQQCSDCPPELLQTPAYKQGERDLAATKQLVVLAGPAKAPSLTGKDITAFDALTSGEVFVALASGALLVLPAVGEPVTLPPPAGTGTVALHGLVARAPDDVLGFGSRDQKAYLLRYDGTTLTTLDAPACGPGLASLSIAGTTWWATCANPPPRNYDMLGTEDGTGSLWRREGAGAWERVTLGEGIEARVVVARGPDDIWLSTYGEHGGVVLHSQDHERVIALGDMLDIVRKGFFPGPPRPAP